MTEGPDLKSPGGLTKSLKIIAYLSILRNVRYGVSMKCPKCGAENDNDAEFCSLCHANFRTKSVPNEPDTQKKATNFMSEPAFFLILYYGGQAVLFLISLLVVIYVLVTKMGFGLALPYIFASTLLFIFLLCLLVLNLKFYLELGTFIRNRFPRVITLLETKISLKGSANKRLTEQDKTTENKIQK